MRATNTARRERAEIHGSRWTNFLLLASSIVTMLAPRQASAEPSETAAAEATPTELEEPEPPSPRVVPYGLLRLDMIFDDSTMQNAQFAFWALSEDPDHPQGVPTNDEELTIHARMTRIGLDLTPIEVGSGTTKIDAKVELDFQAGARDSRNLVRMRHAYGVISHRWFSVLAGQTNDLISPLGPSTNTDGYHWNAGNTGDRRPQLRLQATPKLGVGTLRIGVAAGSPNAVDGQDLDGNGQLDGFDAAVPMMQGLVEISGPFWTETRPFTLGLWGHYAVEKVNDLEDPPTDAIDFDATTRLQSWSVGAHMQVPFTDKIGVRGEVFFGQDLSDIRGGIGQAIALDTLDEVKSVGGFGELGADPLHWLSIYTGGSIDDPLPGALSTAQRTRNLTAYGALRFRPWKPVVIQLEYIYFQTRYQDFGPGTANRVNLWTAIYF